jgi:hypothetical protein
MPRVPQTLTIENLQSRDCTRAGVRHPGRIAHGHHVEVAPGLFIRLYGIETNCHAGPKAYDRTFRVGDSAEYDSHNLHYLGTIVGIGAKTVTIAEDDGRRSQHRLSLYDFSWRNRDLDLRALAERNHDVLLHC